MNTPSDFEINAYRQSVTDFTKKEIRPEALEFDRFPYAEFNHSIIDTLFKNELLCPTLPETEGGPESGFRMLGAMLEEISKEDASTALIIFIQSLASTLLIESGKKDQAKDYFDASSKTSPKLLSFPVYADPHDLPDTISADITENGFRLNGQYTYIPCLSISTAVMLPAMLKTDKGLKFFIIPCDTPGVSISDPIVSLGLRGCPVCDITLRDVSLSKEALLNTTYDDKKFTHICERFRAPLTAISLGILKGAYSSASRYAKERHQAKKQIIEHDMIRVMLSHMIAWIDMAAVSVDAACQLADTSDSLPTSTLLSIQHLVSTAATRATTDGVQILGGYGYMHEYGQEKRMRDAKQVQSVFGSHSTKKIEIIQRNV